MALHTKIEWVVAVARAMGPDVIPATWNPISGCSRASDGCRNCYAAAISHRFGAKGNGVYAGLTDRDQDGVPRFTGTVRLEPARMTWPLTVRQRMAVFVSDMADLFHPAVEEAWLDRIFAVAALRPDCVFMVLTKRPERMQAYLSSGRATAVGMAALDASLRARAANPRSNVGAGVMMSGDIGHLKVWPLPNLWVGTTVEHQAAAAERIPHLLATPAAVRFLSCEPLLGPVDLTSVDGWGDIPSALNEEVRCNALTGEWSRLRWTEVVRAKVGPHLDWVIAGGESGGRARPSRPDWFRSLRDQCAAATVSFFFKQWGEFIPVGQDLPGFGKVHGATAVTPGRMKLHYGGGRGRAPQHAFTERGVELRSMPDGSLAFRVGKGRAGRLLDGEVHDAVPDIPR